MRRLKLISLLTCFLFLFSFTTTVFASEGDSKTKSVTVNEYEMLQSLSKNSTEQLAKLGYSSAEAKQIENYQEEYKNHLKKIAALDDELLKEMGYTSEQIEILRTYDGSEEATIILAATLNISVTAGSVTYYTSKNYTDASVSYSFSWSGEPLFKGTDIVGIAWNDWDLRSSSGKVHI